MPPLSNAMSAAITNKLNLMGVSQDRLVCCGSVLDDVSVVLPPLGYFHNMNNKTNCETSTRPISTNSRVSPILFSLGGKVRSPLSYVDSPPTGDPITGLTTTSSRVSNYIKQTQRHTKHC